MIIILMPSSHILTMTKLKVWTNHVRVPRINVRWECFKVGQDSVIWFITVCYDVF